MKSLLVRSLVSSIAGIAFGLASVLPAHAQIICEDVEVCENVYRINDDGYLYHTYECRVEMDCYDDGNGPSKGGKMKCVKDKITGQKVCVMP